REQAAADFERKYGTHLTSPEGAWYRLGEAVIAGDTRLYRVAPTVGFAFGKLPTSSQTRYTWPGDDDAFTAAKGPKRSRRTR
ncbi:MAG: hypothetical protein GEV10_23120, partial [Streptosporangiales bacterium]|nr:hypothetical protein [Streptosporangiales bacterium]